MKVIIIGPAYPYRGGIADTNESLCQSLVDAGHDVSIITFTLQYPEFLFPGKTQYSDDKNENNLKIQRLINSVNPFNWPKVARILNQNKPDLIVVRYWLPFFAPCLGSIMKLTNKSSIKIGMCDNVIPHERRFGDAFLTKYFISAVDAFITLSNTTLKELNSMTSKPKTYFPHPININLGERVSRKQALEYLNLDSDEKYLLFFGLVRDYKGLDLTIEALGVLAQKDIRPKLLIAGEFYEPLEKYQNLIKRLSLQNQVIIVNQFIPSSEIKYYFSAADLVVQTYKTASQSGITQMALHFNCPILTTNVGGLAEIVIHNQIGYVCEKDPTQIAHFLEDYLRNDKKQYFQSRIDIEKKKYSWKNFIDELLKLYEALR